jgi:hypothetical protein
MTKEEIIEMACQAFGGVIKKEERNNFTAFAKLVAEKERELVANWLMRKGFATGHGDSIVDMLDELEWQVAEREREACAEICDGFYLSWIDIQGRYEFMGEGASECAGAIRARGQE